MAIRGNDLIIAVVDRLVVYNTVIDNISAVFSVTAHH